MKKIKAKLFIMFLIMLSFVFLIVLAFSLFSDNWLIAMGAAVIVIALEIVIIQLKDKNHIHELEDWEN